MLTTQPQRPIRSFVRRQGRITQAQNTALDQLWPVYGLDPEHAFDPFKAFGRIAPLVLEIGFGNGESLAKMAAATPDTDFLGIEVHRPGVGHLLLKIHELGLGNVKVYCADAVEILSRQIAQDSLDGVQVFFPDPWHKKRHHKRRLVNDRFVGSLAGKLKPGGLLHCATDWEHYAWQMLEALSSCPCLRNRDPEGGFSERPNSRPQTKFEARGHRLGHGVWDLLFEKV